MSVTDILSDGALLVRVEGRDRVVYPGGLTSDRPLRNHEPRLAVASSAPSVPAPDIALVGAGQLGRRVATVLLSLHPRSLAVVDDSAPNPDQYPGPVPATSAQALAHELGHVAVTAHSLAELVANPWAWGVVVVATDQVEPERGLADILTRRGVTQLFVRLHGDCATVGPLVVPGGSACLHCLDLTVSRRDPLWAPTLLELIRTRTGIDPVATDWAAAQTGVELGWYLRSGKASTIDGLVRMSRTHPGVEHVQLRPHPGCHCQTFAPDAAALGVAA